MSPSAASRRILRVLEIEAPADAAERRVPRVHARGTLHDHAAETLPRLRVLVGAHGDTRVRAEIRDLPPGLAGREVEPAPCPRPGTRGRRAGRRAGRRSPRARPAGARGTRRGRGADASPATRRLALGQELAVDLDLRARAGRGEPRLPEPRALLAKEPRLDLGSAPPRSPAGSGRSRPRSFTT